MGEYGVFGDSLFEEVLETDIINSMSFVALINLMVLTQTTNAKGLENLCI